MPNAEVSIPVALTTGTLVYTIYSRGLPSNADIRVGQQGDETIETIRRQNAYMAAATVSGISLITKDYVPFIVGGLMLIGLDWMTRLNNWTNPLSGRVDVNPFTVEQAKDMNETPTDAYTDLGVVA